MKVPLGVFTCLTGVSGSGKSTLAHDVLYLNALVEKGAVCEEEPARVKSIKGWEHLDEVVMVDQSPIVRTPRSTPAVYAGVFEEIRSLFAETETARARGLKPGFSLSTVGTAGVRAAWAWGVRKWKCSFFPTFSFSVRCATVPGTGAKC